MPVYEYLCPRCDSRFELLRPISRADEAVSCPRCNNDTRRLLSPFASFSRSAEGISTPTAGASPCSTCTAASCDTCH